MCILLLSSCTSEKTKDAENEIPDFYGFTTDVYTTVNDVKICAKAQYVAFDTLTLTFASPETVKDMIINVKDGECEVTLHELSFLLPNDKLPFNALCVSLASCGENIKSATLENGCYSFMSGENQCQIFINEETKSFEKMVVNGVYTLFFENFTYNLGQSE